MNERSHPTNTTLTLAELLDALGHNSFTALCYKPVDGAFTTLVNTPTTVAAAATGIPDADVWFSINPVQGPARTGPRGNADTITALTCLWADLDIKEGACPDLDTAHQLIDDLSLAVGADPIAVIHSGHGLQPLWHIDDPAAQDLDPDRRLVCSILLKRWGRLVQTIAGRRHIQVDSVFDLPRILRAPGTVNHKAEPVPAWCEPGTGAPLTLDEISERLDERDIPALDCDQLLDEPVDTTTWAWKPDGTCTYARKMIAGWATDQPTARHPWLLSQATRLAAAHRAGCLTHTDHQNAIDALVQRMQALCASGSNARAVAPSEVADALRWGEQQAARLTDTALTRELGDHDHTPQLTVITNDNITNLAARTRTTPPPSIGTAALAPAGQPPHTTLTDDGNAQLFVHHHGHHLRYSAARGWLEWTGTHWQLSEDDAPAITAARHIANQLPDNKKELAAHKARSLSLAGVTNMVALARRDSIIRITADELDHHRMLLNTPDGTINLTNGTSGPHQPHELHTKITGVGHDPTMPTPRWHRFLNATFNGDTDMIGFVQRVLGYAATGHVTHHILPFLHGTGGNGKSVLTGVLADVLGDYAITLPSSVLIAQRYSHDTELVRLAGARVAICSEVPTDGRFDEERVKSLTGGDKISARRLYHDPFEFTPSHTLLMAGNHQPAVNSGGESFWRRLRLIPFNHTVNKNERVDGLADILVTEEGPGILAWIVQGAIDATNGLNEPDSVMEATNRYADEEDGFGQFITDCLHIARDSDIVKAKTTDIRKAYSAWCRDAGRPELSAQAFARELVRRTGARPGRTKGARFYHGIALLTDDRDDDGRYGE